MGPTELIKAILEFFKGQPFSNVVAFLQLGLMGAGLWIGLFHLVPAERAAISDLVQQQEAQQTQQIDRVVQGFEKALDRIDRRPVASTTRGQ